jgi:hypothetical protein
MECVHLRIALRNRWTLLLLTLSQIVGFIGHAFFERSHIDVHDRARRQSVAEAAA